MVFLGVSVVILWILWPSSGIITLRKHRGQCLVVVGLDVVTCGLGVYSASKDDDRVYRVQ